MTLKFRTVQLGTPRQPGEGLRIGTVRRPPRGVPKSEYRERDFFDVWLPILGPSQELLATFRSSGQSIDAFFRGYAAEMAETEPRQVIQLLAELAKQTPISVGCYCANEAICHRSVLGELIRAAAGEPTIRPLAADCVYTIAHGDELRRIADKGGGQGELTEGRRWINAARLLRQAQKQNESLPIVFADATDCSRLIFWGRLDLITINQTDTNYAFSKLRPIRGRHAPQELVLTSTNKTIAPGFIRPYALVRTPAFLR
ncbi:MAG TPA: DUF488 family protein [Planctomycetaceae bacterium]|jgi:uncharacterized protein YeaO (DUF488 family)